MLVVLSGLPGVGKTSIARELARRIGAVHLRIDSIEQALRTAGYTVEAEGYGVAFAIAEDNLRLGVAVIGDCVNPWPLTRREWTSLGARCGVHVIEVELVCSDPDEHRRRVESRVPDIPGLTLPAWSDVLSRDYRPWDGDRLVIDTACSTVDASVQRILAVLSSAGGDSGASI